MNLSVEIDARSGFCGGVIRAIEGAEKFLSEHPGEPLYSLGEIVHNEEELNRLSAKGLKSISRLEDADSTVLIRAHGEPPQTYSKAKSLGIPIKDFTCPVVLKLQESIREAYSRVKTDGGSVVIFGRRGHAEILGLQGQTGGQATVVETVEMMKEAIDIGAVDPSRPVELFSQTTGSPSGYASVQEYLRKAVSDESLLKVHNTICSQVLSRHEQLSEFAASHEVIVFVSGRQSSNGKVLFDLCRSVNPRTYLINSTEEVNLGWFRDGDRIGICGATSTPRWLLQEIASKILQLV